MRTSPTSLSRLLAEEPRTRLRILCSSTASSALLLSYFLTQGSTLTLHSSSSGAHVLDIRKQKAFAGFTYKAPRPISRGAIPTGLGGPSSSDELTEPSMLASSATQQQAFPAILSRPNVAPAATVAVGAAAFSGTVRGRALSL